MQTGLLDRLLEVSSLLQEDMRRAFSATSLTESRVHLLWVLQHSGPSTQQMIAQTLDVTPRTVSALVDGLEATGYVHRAPHPSDRRAVLVSLSDAAERMMTTMESDYAHLTSVLEGVVDSADRLAFTRGLDAVASHLRQLVHDEEVRYDSVECQKAPPPERGEARS